MSTIPIPCFSPVYATENLQRQSEFQSNQKLLVLEVIFYFPSIIQQKYIGFQLLC